MSKNKRIFGKILLAILIFGGSQLPLRAQVTRSGFGNLPKPVLEPLTKDEKLTAFATAMPVSADFAAPLPAPTPVKKTPAKNRKTQTTSEATTEKTDKDAAYSPIYALDSKQCKTDAAGNIGEGDDFQKVCAGFGAYQLVLAGFDYRVKHEIRSKGFSVMLFPLETGEAEKYVRADLYDLKLGDKIEWRLDEKGKPFAIIVRAKFYKNTGNVKTFANPKNKVAEFVFVRGLKGSEDLKVDVPTVNTAFNPEEQARSIAAEYLKKHKK